MSTSFQGINRSTAVTGSLNGAKDAQTRHDDAGKETAQSNSVAGGQPPPNATNKIMELLRGFNNFDDSSSG